MAVQLDGVDRKILAAMQEDASRSLDDIAEKAGASRTPVWHRIRKLRAAGIIRQNTVLLDPDKLGLEACFFVLIRTSEHQKDWHTVSRAKSITSSKSAYGTPELMTISTRRSFRR